MRRLRRRRPASTVKLPGGGPPALVTRMSTAPSAAMASATKARRAVGRRRRRRRGRPRRAPIVAGGVVDAARVAAADRHRARLRRQRHRRREAEPGRCAATAAVRPEMPRSIGDRTLRCAVRCDVESARGGQRRARDARLPRRRRSGHGRLPRPATAPSAAARGRGGRRQDRGGQGAGPVDRRRAHPPAVLRGHRRRPGGLRVGLRPPAPAPARRRGRGHRGAAADRSRTSCTPSGSSCAGRCCGPSTGDGEGPPPVLLIDEVDRADDEFEAFLLEILVRLRGDRARARHVPRRRCRRSS